MSAEEMLFPGMSTTQCRFLRDIHFSGLNGGNFSLSVPSGTLGGELLHAVRLSLARTSLESRSLRFAPSAEARGKCGMT